jgi:hypothetical protein
MPRSSPDRPLSWTAVSIASVSLTETSWSADDFFAIQPCRSVPRQLLESAPLHSLIAPEAVKVDTEDQLSLFPFWNRRQQGARFGADSICELRVVHQRGAEPVGATEALRYLIEGRPFGRIILTISRPRLGEGKETPWANYRDSCSYPRWHGGHRISEKPARWIVQDLQKRDGTQPNE